MNILYFIATYLLTLFNNDQCNNSSLSCSFKVSCVKMALIKGLFLTFSTLFVTVESIVTYENTTYIRSKNNTAKRTNIQTKHIQKFDVNSQ